MEIISFNGRSGFLEADVVKAGKGGAADVLDGVVRYLEQNKIIYNPKKKSCFYGLYD
jgi:hypothetical protein